MLKKIKCQEQDIHNDVSVLYDEENRSFYLFSEIDNTSISAIYAQMMKVIMEDDLMDEQIKGYERPPIKLFVNSHGGTLCDMWALIDIMLNSKTPIHTYCTGYAESAGLKIFLAGSKRYVTKHATLMYHQLSSWPQGKYQDLHENQKELEWQQNAIEEYICSRTRIKHAKLKEVRERRQDWNIHAHEAIKLGIADAIWS
jgi:ATP-dependent Clp protease protease subunit